MNGIPFDIQGGAGIFLKKNNSFPYMSEKNKVFNKVKNKKSVLHSVNFFKPFFVGAIKVCK